MGDKIGKELDAFIAFFATFELSHPVAAAADLSDGSVLYQILSTMCASPAISYLSSLNIIV